MFGIRRSSVCIYLVGCLLAALYPTSRISASQANTDVHVVNLSAFNFAVAWNTDYDVHGHLLFGMSCSTATQTGPVEPLPGGYAHLAYTYDVYWGDSLLQPD